MNKRPHPTFECELCGKTVLRRVCRTKDNKHNSYDYKQRFCGKECGYKGRRWRPINPEGHVHSTGYIRVNVRGGGKRFKHQLVMEEKLGRPLRKGENVHHLDGNKVRNDPSNLELWCKHQPPGQRVIDKIQFAIDMLRLYPEFARAAGVELRDVIQKPSPS